MGAAAEAADPPFPYVRAKAYHIPPETTTEESGYFSLCEGRNGKIYIGTAAYGRNSYLVEFDPATEKMRVVLDTHKLVGLPLTPTGYAAQSKIHTRNFVGPSGKIYVGSKQGYPTAAEREALKRGEKIPVYRGGYVMVYDPATDKAENLGMPMPLDDRQIAAGKKEGQGVIDVTADEARGLIYVITCEEQHWMLYDIADEDVPRAGPDPARPAQHADRRPGPRHGDHRGLPGRPLRPGDRQGDASIRCWSTASRSPTTSGAKRVHPDWRITPDGKTAYLQLLDDLRMFRVDLSGAAGQPVAATNLGDRIRGKNPGLARLDQHRPRRPRLLVGPRGQQDRVRHGLPPPPRPPRPDDRRDGRPGRARREQPRLLRLRRRPQAKNPDGSPRPVHGFHTLPDGTLTPLHVIMALIVARDGTIYATTIYPFTLLKVESVKAVR